MRIDLQLYITETSSNTQIELFDFETIEIVQTIQNVKDIKSIFADYSKSFTVPASKNNNKAFKHFYNPNIGRDFPSDLGFAFDSSRRIDAQLHINHRLFKKGRIQLDSVNMKDGKPYSYGLTFFGSTITLSDSLGETKLDELTFLADIDLDFTEANLLSLLQTPQDITINSVNNPDALLVPLIAVSKALKYDSFSTTKENNLYPHNNQKGLDINDVKPAIRLDAIMNAIEAQFTNINFAKTTDTGSALPVSNVFFRQSNTPYYNLYLWLNKEKGQMKDREEFKPTSKKIQGGDFTAARGDTDEYGLTDFNLPPTNNGYLHIFDEKQVEYYLETRITPTDLTEPYNYVVYRQNEEFRRFDNLVGATIPTTIMPRTFGVYGLGTGSYSFYIESFSSNDFDINFKVQKNRPPDINIFNILVATRTVAFDASISIGSTKSINIAQLLPGEIRVLDLLTSLFKMFNLTAQIDPLTNKINIRTLDQFYADGSTVDITKYIDRSEHNIRPAYPFKKVLFEYEGRDTILAQNHEDTNPKGWGSEEYKRPSASNQEVFEENQIGEEYTISVPLEHHKFNRLFDQDDESVGIDNATKIQWGYSVDQDENPIVGKPLLFYNINVTDLSFNSQTQIEVVKTGASELISSVNMPSNSVAFTDSDNINFGAELNEFAGVPFIDETLFNKYYRNYITDIFDIERRLFKFNAYIPADVLTDIKLNDTLIIFDTEYRINQMTTNFMTGLTQFELINKRTDEVLNADGTAEPFVHTDNLSDIATDVSKDVVRVDATLVTVDLTTRTL